MRRQGLEPRAGDEVLGSRWDSANGSHGGAFAHEEAAASVMTGLTALAAMRDAGRIRSGMRVLINGASGGVGTMAVQIAKSLGAEVTGVCGTRNVELVSSLGADHVIDYAAQDFTRGQQRYDVILDNVLNHSPKVVARLLASDGVFIPNSLGITGGLLAGLPRMARAMLMGRGSTDVKLVTTAVNHENLACARRTAPADRSSKTRRTCCDRSSTPGAGRSSRPGRLVQQRTGRFMPVRM